MATDITIKNLQTKVPIQIPRINRAVRLAFRHLDIREAELSVVFITPNRMKALNKKYLGHDYVTDVLTFDYAAGTVMKSVSVLMGEVFICPSVAVANAELYATTSQRELELYVIHGILHLSGYDDHLSRDIKRMRSKESEILAVISKSKMR